MEQSAEISDALRLETIEFHRSMIDAVTEADAEVKKRDQELTVAGAAHSGRRYLGEMEIRLAKVLGEVIEKAIDKRKELGRRIPDLLTTPRLNHLQDKLHRHVDDVVKSEEGRIAMGGTRYVGISVSLKEQLGRKASEMKVRVVHSLEALRLEARIGMHAEEKPVTIFKISSSTIANLNLGTVIGDLTASVQVLNDQGQKEFAGVIQALTEALAKSEALQEDRRRELLEHLSLVSTETAMPPEKRKTGLLKSSIATLRQGLANAAQLAGLWSAAEHLLKTMNILPSS